MVQLNVSVTLEKDSDPTIDDELVKTLMDEIQREMDEDIMRKVYIEQGWTEVKFRYTNNKQAVDILDWCAETLPKNQWQRLGGSFVFKDPKDAEWFLLRWL
jgi:hypothetical protein